MRRYVNEFVFRLNEGNVQNHTMVRAAAGLLSKGESVSFFLYAFGHGIFVFIAYFSQQFRCDLFVQAFFIS